MIGFANIKIIAIIANISYTKFSNAKLSYSEN